MLKGMQPQRGQGGGILMAVNPEDRTFLVQGVAISVAVSVAGAMTGAMTGAIWGKEMRMRREGAACRRQAPPGRGQVRTRR